MPSSKIEKRNTKLVSDKALDTRRRAADPEREAKHITKLLSKLKEISFSIYGLSVTPNSSERSLVLPLITYFEHKRAIFSLREGPSIVDHVGRDYPYFKSSVIDMRERLLLTMEQVSRERELFKILRQGQDAITEFLERDREHERSL